MGNALRPASAVAWSVYGLRAESKDDAASYMGEEQPLCVHGASHEVAGSSGAFFVAGSEGYLLWIQAETKEV